MERWCEQLRVPAVPPVTCARLNAPVTDPARDGARTGESVSRHAQRRFRRGTGLRPSAWPDPLLVDLLGKVSADQVLRASIGAARSMPPWRGEVCACQVEAPGTGWSMLRHLAF